MCEVLGISSIRRSEASRKLICFFVFERACKMHVKKFTWQQTSYLVKLFITMAYCSFAFLSLMSLANISPKSLTKQSQNDDEKNSKNFKLTGATPRPHYQFSILSPVDQLSPLTFRIERMRLKVKFLRSEHLSLVHDTIFSRCGIVVSNYDVRSTRIWWQNQSESSKLRMHCSIWTK